jgi:hypothetical protein
MSLWSGGYAFDRMTSASSSLGLDPQAMYILYRPPDELAKAVPTCVGLPVLTSHEPVDAVEFRPDLLVGATLSDAQFRAPHLLCSLAIWAQGAIDDIEAARRARSAPGIAIGPSCARESVPMASDTTESWPTLSLIMSRS